MPTAEQLLDQGIEIPDDPIAIARLLDTATAAPAAEPAPAAKPDAAPPAEPPVAAAPPVETPEKAPAAPPAAAADPAATPAPAVPDSDDDAEKGPPRALLRGYRQAVHEKDRQLETVTAEKEEALKRANALEAEITALKAKAGEGQESLQRAAEAAIPGVELETLTPEKIAALRREHPDDIVDAIVSYAKAYETVQEQVNNLLAVQQNQQQAELFEDIDSVPLLGLVRLSNDAAADGWWKRAVAYQAAVKADPDFAGKSRREVFQEVGRRMEGFLGKDTLTKLMGSAPAPAAAPKPAAPGAPATPSPAKEIIDKALEAARKSTVPTSLSDIPAAGGAVAADGLQRLEAISYTDLADLMDKAIKSGTPTDAIINRFLAT